MNTQKLELCILNAAAIVEGDQWLPCSIGELQNRMRAIDTEAANAHWAHIVDAIICLTSEGYLLLRKWRNGGWLSFNPETQHEETYLGGFFYQDSFQLKLTHQGRRRLGEGSANAESTEAEDHRLARLAIQEARKSIPEDDGRTHPLVGAVVAKDGKVLATAHRGEVRGNHAEYTALEKRLSDSSLAGATIYTTLEPCTRRNPPKIPCAERIIERKIRRVLIGMLDPDPNIRGLGQRRLRDANIITELFPHELMAEVEELNREFSRQFESPRGTPPSVQNAVAPSPKHNIRFLQAKIVHARSGLGDALIYESAQAPGDFQVSVVCFRNEPIVGQKVQQPTLKSHITYKDKKGNEITDAPRGVWMEEYGDATVFEWGRKKCLIIFLLSKQGTLRRLWNEQYATEHLWMASGPVFRISDDGIPGKVASVEVRLLAQDICVLSAEFDVKEHLASTPPELSLRSISLA